MSSDNRRLEEFLLDLHLGRLDEPDRAELEARLEYDGELREKSERLGHFLRPLDHWVVGSTPENLADKILAMVRPLKFQAPAVDTISPVLPAYRRPPFVSMRGVIAAAASIAIITALGIPAFSTLRSRTHQIQCANNLGNIFRGTTLYQQAFAALPFAGSREGASWLPGGCVNSPYESNSRHIFLIAKYNYGPSPSDFVCPASTTDSPMKEEQLAAYNDFPCATNISYDTLSMVGRIRGLRSPRPIAYASDRNPLFVGGRFDDSIDPSKTNSPTHRGRVQSVLILDGAVIQMTTPVYGPTRDNLWLAGNIRHYIGTETPAGPDDAFLIPGHPVTDLVSPSRPLH